ASNPEKSSFRALVTEWLRKNYPKSEITELNVAINNTGASGSSLYGALRARRDVVAYKPDLVFVEFAANDTNEDEAGTKKAIEGLLAPLAEGRSAPGGRQDLCDERQAGRPRRMAGRHRRALSGPVNQPAKSDLGDD